jgi:hypothetical protein
MWRFLAGVGAALLLVTAGVLIWRNQAPAANTVAAAQQQEPAGGVTLPKLPDPGPAVDSTLNPDDFPDLPAATEKTREAKRFERYDKNKNGHIDLEEFIANQRRSFQKMDLNHDGVLSFEEYAAKRVEKFRKADANGDNVLTPAEFATTAIKHKPKPKCSCGKAARGKGAAPAEGPADEQ